MLYNFTFVGWCSAVVVMLWERIRNSKNVCKRIWAYLWRIFILIVDIVVVIVLSNEIFLFIRQRAEKKKERNRSNIKWKYQRWSPNESCCNNGKQVISFYAPRHTSHKLFVFNRMMKFSFFDFSIFKDFNVVEEFHWELLPSRKIL